MTAVGIVTGAGRGMGAACAARIADLVDVLFLVDRDGQSVVEAAKTLSSGGHRADLETVALDITDASGLERLAYRASGVGTLRAVAHAAGVSPTMADWRAIVNVDLVATAQLCKELSPLATAGTAIVCFASMAPLVAPYEPNTAAEAAIADPLDPRVLDRLREAVGPTIEDSGMAYTWAKRGVHRLVQREAIPLGRRGARICSISPGIIDTPMGRQEAATHTAMQALVQHTPLGREGRAEEVAAAAAFLLSDEASFISGIDVLVDGGVVAALRNATTPDWSARR